MSTTATTLPTVRALLFPGADSVTQVERQLEERSALGPAVRRLDGVPSGLVEVAAGKVGAVLAGLLDIEAFDLLAGGWRKHEALMTAARQTAESQGGEQIVELATHRITSTHRPKIDVEVDDARVGSIDVEIDVTFVLHAVRAVVAGGRLVALRSGLVDLEASLSCEGLPIASERRQVDLALEVGLGSGIPLIEHVVLPEAPAAGV
jgi:hypothetical protein